VPACSPAPAIAPFLEAFPKPNGAVSAASCTGVFIGTYANRATLDAGSIRIDHRFGDRFSIFGRYNDAPSQEIQRALSLSNLNTIGTDTRTFTLGANMTFTPELSNFIRGNYSTQTSNIFGSLDSFGGAVPVNPSLLSGSLSSANTFSSFAPQDTTQYQLGLLGRSRATQMNFVDDLVLVKGGHQLKFGTDYRAIFTTTNHTGMNTLFFLPSSVQSFISSSGQAFFEATSSTVGKLLVQSLSLYAQDTWKATARLAVTYGLRWELSPAPSGRDGTNLGAWENVTDSSALVLAPIGTPMWKTTYGNLAPRIGIAYSVGQKGDLVLRAGWGLFYDLGVGQAANALTTFPNLATAITPTVTMPLADPTPFLPSLSTTPPYGGAFAQIWGVAPNLKLPRSYEWNVAVEKSFGEKGVISATYVGQLGRQLLRNEGLSPTNVNFPPGSVFFLTLNDATSDYEALQLQYRKPLAARFQVLFNYTWSHSLDNASNDTLAAVSGIVIPAGNDRASSDFDVRHSFSGALTYNVPSVGKSGPLFFLTRGWSLDTVVVARSGFPFNALSVIQGPIGAAFPRPDLVPGQPLWVSTPGAPGGKVLNPLAFATPATLRQGNEPRNDIPGFGLTQVDFSMGRKLPITERLNVQLRADAFNLFNHPNFANPLGYIGIGSIYLQSQSMLNKGLGGLNPLFQEGGPRSLQVSLRLLF